MRVADWLPFKCGDPVCDAGDPRHVGVVVAIAHGAVVTVRWENGWMSKLKMARVAHATESPRVEGLQATMTWNSYGVRLVSRMFDGVALHRVEVRHADEWLEGCLWVDQSTARRIADSYLDFAGRGRRVDG